MMLNKKRLDEFQIFEDKRFTKRDVFKTDSCLVFVLNFLPGQHMPAHLHPGKEMNFHILQGTGVLSIGQVEEDVAAGDIVSGSGEEMIAFRNTGDEPVSIHVVMNEVCG